MPNRCKCEAIGILAVCAEDGIAAGRQWSDLSERTRRLLAITAVAEGALKPEATGSIFDINHRDTGWQPQATLQTSSHGSM